MQSTGGQRHYGTYGLLILVGECTFSHRHTHDPPSAITICAPLTLTPTFQNPQRTCTLHLQPDTAVRCLITLINGITYRRTAAFRTLIISCPRQCRDIYHIVQNHSRSAAVRLFISSLSPFSNLTYAPSSLLRLYLPLPHLLHLFILIVSLYPT